MAFNFIDYFIEYTAEAESPESFWRWSAISALSTTLRSNVFVKCSIGTIYPNMFILLFSDSGIARKAAPCKFCARLLNDLRSTKVINGRASMQAVIKELASASTDGNGVSVSGASGLLYTEELSSFAVNDPATIPLLTDLYDFHEKWSTNLISGTHKLERVCLSMLGATNSDLFRSVYTEAAVKGGLLGRTFIVAEKNARHRKSLLDLEEPKLSYQPLLDHLKVVRAMSGAVTFSKEARDFYNDWYYGKPDEYFIDNIGFSPRLGTHVLKVALALAVARGDFDMQLSLEDVEEAVVLCGKIKKNYKEVTVAVGPNQLASQTALMIKIIAKQPGNKIRRDHLVQQMLGELRKEDFDSVVEQLEQANVLETKAKNGVIWLMLTDEGMMKLLGRVDEAS